MPTEGVLLTSGNTVLENLPIMYLKKHQKQVIFRIILKMSSESLNAYWRQTKNRWNQPEQDHTAVRRKNRISFSPSIEPQQKLSLINDYR